MQMNDAIQQAFPLLSAPLYGGVDPAQKAGMRYLVGRQGVYREITLPWIRHQVLIAPCSMPFSLPFGDLKSETDIQCQPLDLGMLKRFSMDARDLAPKEVAAALIWNEHNKQWRYALRQTIDSTDSHVRYREVSLQDGEHLVVDMHSHGYWPAFFSHEDDADDRGAMRFSLVLGSLNEAEPTSKLRLCMAGVFQNAGIGPSGELEVFQ